MRATAWPDKPAAAKLVGMDRQPPETDYSNTQPSRLRQTRRTYDPISDMVAPKDLPLVIGISTATAWRLRRAGQFPLPIKVSPGRLTWRRTDLTSWLAEREKASR